MSELQISAHVESVAVDGVHVESVAVDGVHVESVAVDGVHVESVAVDGVHVESVAVDNYLDGEPVILEDNLSLNLIKKLRDTFGDQTQLMNGILRCYKIISVVDKKQPFDLDMNDLMNEIQATSFNLDESTKIDYENLGKKIKTYCAFCDFCFRYFVQCYSLDTPFYAVPKNVLKLRIICSALGVNTKHSELVNIFASLIEDPILSDMRKLPYFHLRYVEDMGSCSETIRTNIKTIIPVCKRLIELLLKFNNTPDATDDKKTAQTILQMASQMPTVPTDEPVAVPTDEPTTVPTDEPTTVPTDEPTTVPTVPITM
jgi:hypothetical protein